MDQPGSRSTLWRTLAGLDSSSQPGISMVVYTTMEQLNGKARKLELELRQDRLARTRNKDQMKSPSHEFVWRGSYPAFRVLNCLWFAVQRQPNDATPTFLRSSV
jgi:hypothetical protein